MAVIRARGIETPDCDPGWACRSLHESSGSRATNPARVTQSKEGHMRARERLLATTMFVLAAIGFWGCNTVEGVGEDVESVGEEIEEEAEERS
jgi:predicted small secreted protein